MSRNSMDDTNSGHLDRSLPHYGSKSLYLSLQRNSSVVRNESSIIVNFIVITCFSIPKYLHFGLQRALFQILRTRRGNS
jgi:hypothetical protein